MVTHSKSSSAAPALAMLWVIATALLTPQGACSASDEQQAPPSGSGGAGGAGLTTHSGGAGEGGATAVADADRYEPIEIVLQAQADYANPYLEVEIVASVKPPAASGEQPYTIPGFWDGGSSWRVRWAPRVAGDYQVTVESSNPDDWGLDGQSFEYRISAEYSPLWAPHGFVGIDPETQYYFRRDDGSKFLWVGDTNWINLYERA